MDGLSTGMLLIPLAAVIAALVAKLVGPIAMIPLVVFEIVLGIVLGPSALGWVHPNSLIGTLSNFGLVFLFFMAGNEIDFRAIRGRPLNRAAIGWLVSLAAGVVAGFLFSSNITTGVFIGIALSSTALGTLLPIIRDAGELSTPFGRAVTAVGAAGEFGPLIAISLFLSGRRPGVSSLILLAFAVLAGLAIVWASRGRHERLHRLITATLHTSGQFAIRFIVLVVAALVALSLVFGLDMLLGAFAAGVLWRVVASSATEADRETVGVKIDGLAFGFLVPIFFIYTGVTFDLRGLLASPMSLALVPIFLVLLLIVRGLPGLIAGPPRTTGRDKVALTLFTATGLPIIVAVTQIGHDTGLLDDGVGTALVGAGMLSVLLFPLIALLVRRKAAAAPASDEQTAADERTAPDEYA